MQTSDFSFEIPSELVAQEPAAQRDQARLLCMQRGGGPIRHCRILDLPELLPPDALMVFNDTRVRNCRLLGRSVRGGGRIELLLLGRLDVDGAEWSAVAGPARRAAAGATIEFAAGVSAEVVRSERDSVRVRFSRAIDDEYLDRYGHVPLPPYIRRPDVDSDRERYQTVYSERVGSAAAPTAGLHFTRELLQRIDRRGIERRFVTLHVGLGTFRPIRTRNVAEHVMHSEAYSVSDGTAAAVSDARRNERPIVAVGTTTVRTLESAWDSRGQRLRAGAGETELFIYPGYRFQVVDEMITNFHTPQSSLVVMVAAFAGPEAILGAYRTAIAERYRFFSYGDAMYLHR